MAFVVQNDLVRREFTEEIFKFLPYLVIELFCTNISYGLLVPMDITTSAGIREDPLPDVWSASVCPVKIHRYRTRYNCLSLWWNEQKKKCYSRLLSPVDIYPQLVTVLFVWQSKNIRKISRSGDVQKRPRFWTYHWYFLVFYVIREQVL